MDVRTPKVGERIHFFPGSYDATCRYNGALCLPAVVVQSFGLTNNINVSTANPDAPTVVRYSVQHASQIFEGADASFWDYAEDEFTAVLDSVNQASEAVSED